MEGLPGALRCNWAGTPCVGWTQVGAKLCFADPSERYHAVWLTERMQMATKGLEDMFVQENVTSYPFKAKLRDPLQATHQVIRLVVASEDLGWPSRRRRSFCCGLVRSRLTWVGPENDSDIQAEFDSIFKRQTMLDGNVFLLAPPSEVRAWYAKKLLARGIHVDDIEGLSIPNVLRDILPPGARQRLTKYEEMVKQSPATSSSSGSGTGAFLADVEHWPGVAIGRGSDFPCQLKHGTVVSLSGSPDGRRVFMGSEHLAALGWHMFDSTSTRFTSHMKDILSKFPGHAQKAFSGNGMSLPALAAFSLYIWANTVRAQDEEGSEPENTQHGPPAPEAERGGAGDLQANLEEEVAATATSESPGCHRSDDAELVRSSPGSPLPTCSYIDDPGAGAESQADWSEAETLNRGSPV